MEPNDDVTTSASELSNDEPKRGDRSKSRHSKRGKGGRFMSKKGKRSRRRSRQRE